MEQRTDAGPYGGRLLDDALRAGDHVQAARVRERSRPEGADRLSGLLVGGSFAAIAVLLALFGDHARPSFVLLPVLLLLYVLASRTTYEIGPGSAVPTQVVLVPMLLLLPLWLVPLMVATGLVLGGVIDQVHRGQHRERLIVLVGCAWHALGPVAVLHAAGTAAVPARPGAWAWFLAALGAQFLLDSLSTIARNRFGLGVPLRPLLGALGWTFAVDALLAPIGLAAAALATGWGLGWTVLACAAPVLALALLAADRRRQVDRALTLSSAYAAENERARRDPLTGIGNRRAWQEALARIAPHRGLAVGIIVIDVDGLKRANDAHGHVVGDAVIREVAALVRATAGEADTVARVGGDEFAVLLVGEAAAQHAAIARQIRDALGRHPGVQGVAVAASVGSAACPPEPGIHAALEAADRAAYAEKARRGDERVA